MPDLFLPLVPALRNSALFIAGFFVLGLWLASLALRDSSIVDIFWGLGCAAVAWVAWLTVGGGGTRATVMLVAATLWGVRLGLYIPTTSVKWWFSGACFRSPAMRGSPAP